MFRDPKFNPLQNQGLREHKGIIVSFPGRPRRPPTNDELETDRQPTNDLPQGKRSRSHRASWPLALEVSACASFSGACSAPPALPQVVRKTGSGVVRMGRQDLEKSHWGKMRWEILNVNRWVFPLFVIGFLHFNPFFSSVSLVGWLDLYRGWTKKNLILQLKELKG